MAQHPEAYYRRLARKWEEGTITPEEAKEYLDWYNADDENPLTITPEFASGKEVLQQRMLASIREQMKNSDIQQVPVIPLRKKITRIAAAAAIVFLLATGGWFLLNNKSGPTQKGYPVARIQDPNFKNDVLPGSFKARLTLADGNVIVLDSASAGELVKQGTTAVINKNGQLVYINSEQGIYSGQPLYNSLTTAKGETYATVLADGSKVWLNSGSSIKYPVAFSGNERKVEITGEAYFEIAHNAAKPFVVNANNKGNITVLGTHFNVNAYDDEAAIKTTLLEGSVRFTELVTNSSKTITPGQQVVSRANGLLSINTAADLEQTMAWKNGLFNFKTADIATVLRQAVRWYNIDIKYEGAVTKDTFSGTIPRSATLTELLSILRVSRVNFKLDGNTLTVLP